MPRSPPHPSMHNHDHQSGDVLRLGSGGGGGSSCSSSDLNATYNALGCFMQKQNPSFHEQQDPQQRQQHQ
ncbi:unnamed protein product [Microthlaspi erraticum]|uniref:Uncharacterized protein n=1 Tax=Microthlaspi erraticum TaxID=1685480 RepID=A0A6D2KUX9_9BRAS|nr:unnamed protein product [Microthlaspi erraticum]